MGLKPFSGHGLLKAGLAVGVVVVAVMVVMSVVSMLVGALWTIVEIAVLVGVVGGVWHRARRRNHLGSGGRRQQLPGPHSTR